MAKIIKVNGDLEVKKADVIVKARYKLNPLSLKFITTLIAGLKRSDNINEVYKFRVKEFKELTQLKRKDIYWAIKEALKELLEKPLYIPKSKDENDNSFLMLNWVASAEYKEGEGAIEFEISNKLRPYLLEAKEKFLKYKLENILPLKSSYVIRLYEILKDWLSMHNRYGNKTEKIISLDEFRKVLEIPKSYQYSSGIKKRILEKAETELKKHTDIIFAFKEIKTGRKITHIKFIIEENPKNSKENKDIYSFMKTLRSFINYIRKHYINKAIITTIDKNTKQKIRLAISKNNLVYDMYGNIKNYDSERSYEIYKNLYEYAKKNEKYRELLAQKKEFNFDEVNNS
jgi:plasmid replication initiation protein